MQPPHTRPRPCRHFASAARRKSLTTSWLLRRREFLETRVASQRNPCRLESQQSRRQRDLLRAEVIGREETAQIGDRPVVLTETRFDTGEGFIKRNTDHGIVRGPESDRF